MRVRGWIASLMAAALAACAAVRGETYDVIIARGMIYDGSGQAPRVADIAIADDRIAAIGNLSSARAEVRIDASGLAVAPGFINVLSWANESLIEDGRSQSDIRQGVTLEVMGEGESMGPINDAMRQNLINRQGASSTSRHGRRWGNISIISSSAASRRTSRASSAPRRSVSTRWATRTGRPRRKNWRACRTSCVKPCARARWV